MANPKSKYSIFSLVRNALSYHEGWEAQWRSPDPKSAYDVVIIGGGGHGLATAYYLAKEHGITNVAVLEKGWLGGGNTGRNTTIVRSNYLWDESAAIYDHAVNLWENLSQELNYNVMFSPRGLLHLAHNVHDMQEIQRRGNSNFMNGIDAEMLTPGQCQQLVPFMNLGCRYPVMGGVLQRRGGTARHDAVAWGYARAADALGVDIIQKCEVTGFDIENGVVRGVQTTRGNIGAGKVGVVTAGHSGVTAEMAGFRLPIESFPLQAFVSEPMKPVIDVVVMSNTVHAYISQSDKGELVIGGSGDPYISYSQRGCFDQVEHVVGPVIELYPIFSRVRMMRQWGGITDVTIDRSPVITKTPVENMMFNVGWGTGGFKATPGSGHVFAASLAKGEMHDIAAPFAMDRFHTGALIDEAAAAAVAH
ncbi:MAG: sarcosine oxidase subunit beta family protein [Rhodospirillales bacterium]|jgi:sarcosine oxidase, subunit beta|nr:sarcosine oxidase subunit beta family protein [Rhodospirillales bacterium]MBT4625794.1 sarcosine oxidase subunit beta family protein [Rhodospirillales bacterium]MBT5351509.1 sarcosine oxidase subunit beta family protein [Rhodospirillales bacterium]MBT5520032.1 sarcosine oxidase subunit beta family protein [Rhodospirillales bacterium]MBT6111322.1 sarcosine oxidase subunit beta family protein [Rhodospirillales bacterium]